MTYRWHLGLMMVCALAWAVGCDDSGGSDGDGGGGGGDAGDSGNVDDGSVDDAADDGEVAEEGSCTTYCTNVQTNCTGDDHAVYPDNASCMAACAAMPKGFVGDTSMNTVACRAYHANAAAGDADTHCPHAGISSAAGGCGSPCDAYCDQFMANCADDDEAYETRIACETACDGFTDTQDDWQGRNGNTVQCRAYHASYPAVDDAAFHCPHAREDSTDQCD